MLEDSCFYSSVPAEAVTMYNSPSLCIIPVYAAYGKR